MRDHLQALGLASHYARFEAVRGADVAAAYDSPLNAGSIGCGLSHQLQQLNRLATRHRANGGAALVNLRGMPFSGNTSYFVHRNSIGKVADLLGTDWIRQCKHDTFISNLVQAGRLRAFVLMPFLSTRSSLFEESTIDSDYTSLMRAMDLQRAAFYADADLEQLSREAGQLGPGGQRNPLLEIYVETTRSILAHIDQGIHQKTE